MIWPTDSSCIISQGGTSEDHVARKRGFAVDLAPPGGGGIGLPLYAIKDGTVSTHERAGDAGMLTYLYWFEGNVRWRAGYAHQSAFEVRTGSVREGQVIGRMGATGNVTAPHVHFFLEWYSGERWYRMRPEEYLERGDVVEVDVTDADKQEIARNLNILYGISRVLTGEQVISDTLPELGRQGKEAVLNIKARVQLA